MTPFFKNYINEIQYALWTVDTTELKKAAEIIETTANHGGTIYVCGNGGSAAIADHLACDCMKGIANKSYLSPRVVSLSSNGPLITAIANDLGYDQVFEYQLLKLVRPSQDLLITISSSGNSPNIKKALEAAKKLNIKSIAFCGFDGGASLEADVCLHVQAKNYGIVEDCHQSLMHIIAQYLRKTNLMSEYIHDDIIY